jgi:hypothetical protein
LKNDRAEVSATSEEKRKKSADVEELAEVLSVVTDRLPALIKGLMSSVFSEDAAAGIGKAAAAFYKELKAGGIPDDVAVRMTQDYIGTFTKISEFLKHASKEKEDSDDISEELKSVIHRKMKRELEKEEE